MNCGISILLDAFVRNEFYAYKCSHKATVRSLANNIRELGYDISVATVGRWCQESGPLIGIDDAAAIGELMGRDLLYEFFVLRKTAE